MSDLDIAVADYIRQESGHQNITGAQLGKLAGIPYETFKRYFDGTRSMSIGDLSATLDALGVTIETAMIRVRQIMSG